MSFKRNQFVAIVAFFFMMAISCAPALGLRDIRVTIPKHSKLTPVQRLNRDGVEAVRKHDYEKAEALFLKAYLYDPADPFTLNNLGYISELKGNLNRALKFYKLAGEQGSSAVIALSNAKYLQGEPMTAALTGLKNLPMRVNRMNVQAIELLQQNRSAEADAVLRKALVLQPSNPFTLNNLGVAEESTGNLESALRYYNQAAESGSKEPIVIALERSWRGKPVSEMAEDSAQRLRRRLQNIGTAEARAQMLTYRGVSAVNRNDWSAAKKDFLEAYSLNPDSAFAINNRGYVAEKNGDMETAQFFYFKARQADNAGARVGLATSNLAQGKPLTAVAGENHSMMDSELAEYARAAHRQTGPIQLIRRDNSPAAPAKPAQPGASVPTGNPGAATPLPH